MMDFCYFDHYFAEGGGYCVLRQWLTVSGHWCFFLAAGAVRQVEVLMTRRRQQRHTWVASLALVPSTPICHLSAALI